MSHHCFSLQSKKIVQIKLPSRGRDLRRVAIDNRPGGTWGHFRLPPDWVELGGTRETVVLGGGAIRRFLREFQ